MVVRDRDERSSWKASDNRGQIRSVKAIVERGEVRHLESAQQRQVQPVSMAMHNVEVERSLRYHLKQGGVGWERVWARLAEPNRASNDGNETGRGLRISARKKRDVVAKDHELLSEP